MALPAPLAATDIRRLAEQVRPVALAGERRLPVLPALATLLPGGGLRRGSVVSVSASTSLALALMAAASAAGSWCAGVGLSSLGLQAAAELGVVLERFPLVATPRRTGRGGWAWTIAALLDAFDVVLARPPSLGAEDVRRLLARARERGSVLVLTGGRPSSGVADLELHMVHSAWEGVAQGHGRLRARRMEVVVSGRRSGAPERRCWLWLPGPDGEVAVAEPPRHRRAM